MKYQIDYVGGTHGHYLEFLCNKYIEGLPDMPASPFNTYGTSDTVVTTAMGEKGVAPWHARHFYMHPSGFDTSLPTVKILFDLRDILLVVATNISRASRAHGVDASFDTLHINTYNKLFGTPRAFMLEEIKEKFNSYNWYDFDFNSNQPHCPIYVLREYFKDHWFTNQSPVMRERYFMMQETLYRPMWPDYEHKEHPNHIAEKQMTVQFRDFYDYSAFLDMLRDIAAFVGKTFVVPENNELLDIFNEFVSNNPYADIQTKMAERLNAIDNYEILDITDCNVLEQAYIEDLYSTRYKIEFKYREDWFTDTKELAEYIDECRRRH